MMLRADTGQILPVAVVTAYIIVDKLLLEPCRAVMPVQPRFVHETAGHQLPGTRECTIQPMPWA